MRGKKRAAPADGEVRPKSAKIAKTNQAGEKRQTRSQSASIAKPNTPASKTNEQAEEKTTGARPKSARIAKKGDAAKEKQVPAPQPLPETKKARKGAIKGQSEVVEDDETERDGPADIGSGKPTPRSWKSYQARSVLLKTGQSEELKLVTLPKDTIGDVRDLGEGEYEFEFPIAQLKSFHRLAWTVSDKTTSILVRVVFLRLNDNDSRGFCVHLLPDSSLPKARHVYCFTKHPWDNCYHAMACSSHVNFLTYVLGCGLHDLLSRKSVDVQEIHDMILELIQSDPGVECIVCGKALSVKLWRPSACSKECTKILQSWPLDVRLSPLLLDHRILDLLLCCCHTSALSAKESGHPVCSEVFNSTPVLDSIPKLAAGMTASDLVGTGSLRTKRKNFLSWLCNTFLGCIICVPEERKVQIDKKTAVQHQFLQLNAESSVQKSFMKHVSSPDKAGAPAFHGTPARNLTNILSSHLELRNGGIWYAYDPWYSYRYASKEKISDLRPWKHSQFSKCNMLFGLEVAEGPLPTPASEAVTRKATNVMIRYIFMLPPRLVEGTVQGTTYIGHSQRVDSEPVKRVMRRTFRRIHHDTLDSVRLHVEGAASAESAEAKSESSTSKIQKRAAVRTVRSASEA